VLVYIAVGPRYRRWRLWPSLSIAYWWGRIGLRCGLRHICERCECSSVCTMFWSVLKSHGSLRSILINPCCPFLLLSVPCPKVLLNPTMLFLGLVVSVSSILELIISSKMIIGSFVLAHCLTSTYAIYLSVPFILHCHTTLLSLPPSRVWYSWWWYDHWESYWSILLTISFLVDKNMIPWIHGLTFFYGISL